MPRVVKSLATSVVNRTWMEVAYSSRRTDFRGPVEVVGKTGKGEVEVKVLEIAIGLDRCVYDWSIADQQDLI